MRPMAPPLRFWKSSASTTCSRETFPSLVRMRPMGRPLSSAIWGVPPAAPAAVEAAPAAAPPPGLEPGAGAPAAGAPGARAAGFGDRPAAGLFGRAAGFAGGETL